MTQTVSGAIFRDAEVDRRHTPAWYANRALIYGALILWAVICLFPIYWTISTSFKMAPDVMQGRLLPISAPPVEEGGMSWLLGTKAEPTAIGQTSFAPAWLGWRSLGLSPDTIGEESTVRDEFLKRFVNSTIIALTASTLAVLLGSLAAYGLSRFQYRWAWMKNDDISFFFLSQLILPPVVLALPILVLYKELGLLDTRIGLILLYTLSVLPIVIWIMRDQFAGIPTELEEAAMVDGLGAWGAFFTIILPIALPGMVAAFILSLVLTWNEYFFAALLTSTYANTLPVMVASQTGSQGISWWSMAALSTAAILPLIVIAVLLERFIIKGMAAGAVK
ncbi:MAG: sugar ABC transporter permease [Rhodobacterales bacterium 12-65-15]|nr:MAG: sugar ABC transporter permease [Rhodobacterales bacterium 12-65-15]